MMPPTRINERLFIPAETYGSHVCTQSEVTTITSKIIEWADYLMQ